MLNKKLISIIVPIYNVEKYLDRCIESLVNQTYKEIQIILVNDGSTDNSKYICDKWKKIDQRIEIINKNNGGLSSARNTGIERVEGDYFLLVDSDDYIELDTCERFYNAFSRNDADLYVGDYIQQNGNEIRNFNRPDLVSNKVMTSKEFILHNINYNSWYAPSWLNLYKTSFFKENKLLFKENRVHEDVEIQLRLFLTANKIIYIDYAFYHYILRSGSIMTQKKTEKYLQDTLLNYQGWRNDINKINDEELKNILLGFLAKYYLYSSRTLEYRNWNNSIISYKEAKKYALNNKEKIKSIVYNYFPNIYVLLCNLVKDE